MLGNKGRCVDDDGNKWRCVDDNRTREEMFIRRSYCCSLRRACAWWVYGVGVV